MQTQAGSSRTTSTARKAGAIEKAIGAGQSTVTATRMATITRGRKTVSTAIPTETRSGRVTTMTTEMATIIVTR